MTAEQYKRVKEVFLALTDCPEDRQDEEIARLCAGDAELSEEVASLLHSHRHASKLGSMEASEEKENEEMTTEPEPPAVSQEIRPLEPFTDKKPTPRHSAAEYRSHASLVSRVTSGHSESGTPKGRFESGMVVAQRYRIVSLLGSGGMGEVYRADDLTLDQAVALKFLPKSFENNPTWLERFHNEVRLSRQVTHPNVCRVFDIGEVEGEQFISMEFVDGEDLASLLRRIGRLPRDKAIQIARELCAGIAAAHDKGVLHRDLKPANIMLDGRGQVRITDFGISGRVDGNANDTAAGTPAYMAPEQFSKGEATVRSDIYALGLVLYEIFTGRQAFTAHSMPEYARLHKQTNPTHPSTFIADMDPLAERVILRCLEKDPSKRPGSALAVAAALPGGDPLAAVLAAGETPSPQMVAAAGGAGLTVIRAAILLAIAVVGIVAAVLLSPRAMLLPRLQEGIKAPAVLTDRALQILSDAGYSRTWIGTARSAHGFALNDKFIGWIIQKDNTVNRWNQLSYSRPGPIFFWYRQSPQFMVSKDDLGMVTLDEPARTAPDMRTIELDPTGRLKLLQILPTANFGSATPAQSAADIAALFRYADLDPAQLKPQTPSIIPPMFVDSRSQWQGVYPENPSQSIRVALGTVNGLPVYFEIRETWEDQADKMGIEANPDLPTGRNIVLQATLIIAAIISSLFLAWRNIRAREGDSEGAQKLAGLFLVLGLLVWLLCSSHIPELFLELRSFFRALGFIVVPAAIVWMFYLALEPHVRKTWPETVISWSRALSGRLTDPLVGSHILAGLAVGAIASVLGELANLLPMHFGHVAAVPDIRTMVRFLAKENPTALSLWALLDALYIGLLYLLSIVLFLIVFRRKWIAAIALVALGAVQTFQWYSPGWVQWAEAGVVMGLMILLLVRYGLVAAIAGLWCIYMLRFIPITADMTVWYASQTRFAVGLICIIATAAATLATGKWRRTAATRTV